MKQAEIWTEGYKNASQHCPEASQARSTQVEKIKANTSDGQTVEPSQHASDGDSESLLDLSGSTDAAILLNSGIKVGGSARLSPNTLSSANRPIATPQLSSQDGSCRMIGMILARSFWTKMVFWNFPIATSPGLYLHPRINVDLRFPWIN